VEPGQNGKEIRGENSENAQMTAAVGVLVEGGGEARDIYRSANQPRRSALE
jgi:hypothetical protein